MSPPWFLEVEERAVEVAQARIDEIIDA
jgi:hypothetical protein